MQWRENIRKSYLYRRSYLNCWVRIKELFLKLWKNKKIFKRFLFLQPGEKCENFSVLFFFFFSHFHLVFFLLNKHMKQLFFLFFCIKLQLVFILPRELFFYFGIVANEECCWLLFRNSQGKKLWDHVKAFLFFGWIINPLTRHYKSEKQRNENS